MMNISIINLLLRKGLQALRVFRIVHMNDCVLFTKMEYANERLLRCARNDSRDNLLMTDVNKSVTSPAVIQSRQSESVESYIKDYFTALAITAGENLQ